MSRRARSSGLAAGASLVALLILLAPTLGAIDGGPERPAPRPDTLPASIPDGEFWSLTEQLSEPNGFFQSDNLLSNEMTLSSVATLLAETAKPDGVYLGVGPEQNFTYIAAMRPKLAFITDIRRGNLHMHLMYKALFELSADRADFVSRLFTKPRPEGLSAKSSAANLMNAFWDVPTSTDTIYQKNLDDIRNVLVKTHAFPLADADLDGVANVYHAFYYFGPKITYTSSTVGLNAAGTSYADLMMARDENGVERSYLASEDRFAFVKRLESNNLVVPVVGDFAGPKALRAVGKYVRDRGATVNAFYVSNVESYLQRNGVWPAFCANVASMPLDDTSVFIRPPLVTSSFYFVTRSGTGTIATVNANGTTLYPAGPGELGRVLATPNGLRSSPFSSMAAETAGCK